MKLINVTCEKPLPTTIWVTNDECLHLGIPLQTIIAIGYGDTLPRPLLTCMLMDGEDGYWILHWGTTFKNRERIVLTYVDKFTDDLTLKPIKV